MSKEYAAAIAILVGSILKGFGVEIGSDVLESTILGALAIYLAFKRHRRGDITLAGLRK